MKPWWQAFSGRLEREEEALRADGIDVERDDAAFARGVVRLRLKLPAGRWLTQELHAAYPDSFPYTRPEVYAPSLALAHHQNPHVKNLCLLPRGSEHWTPSWTLAQLLREQLPKLTTALETTDRAQLAAVEIEQGEPLTYYFAYEEDSVILLDSATRIPDEQVGLFALVPSDNTTQPLRGRIAMVSDASGGTVWSTMKTEEGDEAYVGMWVRSSRPANFDDADALFSELERQHVELAKAPWKKGIQVIAVVFSDELAHRTEGTGWLFLVRRRGEGKGGKKRAEAAFVRSDRAGVDDLATRFPDFRQLQDRGVAVFGLGCIGAPSALEFARAGVGTLNLLDSDFVEAGTVVRWPYGLSAVGRGKVKVLFETINRDYPWVRSLRGHGTRLGTPEQKPHSEREVIELMLTDVNLVYDATGEPGLQYLLANAARDRGLPYIAVSGTRGARGGVVARLNHRDATGCWWCFEAALDKTIASPEADEVGTVQPAGCSRVTYVGANFDMMEVALQGVRLGITTLLSPWRPQSDYAWDVAVVNLTDATGHRIEPRWTVYPLPRNPDCPMCHPN